MDFPFDYNVLSIYIFLIFYRNEQFVYVYLFGEGVCRFESIALRETGQTWTDYVRVKWTRVWHRFHSCSRRFSLIAFSFCQWLVGQWLYIYWYISGSVLLYFVVVVVVIFSWANRINESINWTQSLIGNG